jgi:hypothetical protein
LASSLLKAKKKYVEPLYPSVVKPWPWKGAFMFVNKRPTIIIIFLVLYEEIPP